MMFASRSLLSLWLLLLGMQFCLSPEARAAVMPIAADEPSLQAVDPEAPEREAGSDGCHIGPSLTCPVLRACGHVLLESWVLHGVHAACSLHRSTSGSFQPSAP